MAVKSELRVKVGGTALRNELNCRAHANLANTHFYVDPDSEGNPARETSDSQDSQVTQDSQLHVLTGVEVYLLSILRAIQVGETNAEKL